MSDSECVGWGSVLPIERTPTRNASHFDLPTRLRLKASTGQAKLSWPAVAFSEGGKGEVI
jgi:hypothetical protein